MCSADGMPGFPEYFDETIAIAQYLVDAGADRTRRYVLQDISGNELSYLLVGLQEPATLVEIIQGLKNYMSFRLENNKFENEKEQIFMQDFIGRHE